MTIEQHLLDQQDKYAGMTHDLIQILNDIILASKVIRTKIVTAALTQELGSAGYTNIQAEEVQKLDMFANSCIQQIIGAHGRFAVMGSEEEECVIEPPKGKDGNYVLLFDPLDGSSNIDVNISVGTIFSIYRVRNHQAASVEDCLQPGSQQVAAGYVLYGSSMVLVYTAGHGVHGFTYDPAIGEFLVSHPDIRTPEDAQYYSINDSQFPQLSPHLQNCLTALKSKNNPFQKTLSARYVGSLVADFHRNLLKGGVFIYPGTAKNPNGKLRLVYEANPLAWICEQAGGAATNGPHRILNIKPDSLHERTPLIIGAKSLVNWLSEE